MSNNDNFGYNIGDLGDGSAYDPGEYYGMFGKRVPKEPPMVLSDDDLTCHVYVLGSYRFREDVDHQDDCQTPGDV